jgi:hypothetical protein
MTSIRIVLSEYHSEPKVSRCARLVDDFGVEVIEYHNREWFKTAPDSALSYLHDSLHKYALTEGFLIQDGEKFLAKASNAS